MEHEPWEERTRTPAVAAEAQSTGWGPKGGEGDSDFVTFHLAERIGAVGTL